MRVPRGAGTAPNFEAVKEPPHKGGERRKRIKLHLGGLVQGINNRNVIRARKADQSMRKTLAGTIAVDRMRGGKESVQISKKCG